MTLELDVHKWSEEQFGNCELGDQRRTRRAVKYAAQVASNPDASTPDQTESWSDCKAAYRLMEEEDVTFQALAEPHWRLTRARTSGTWLLLGDTTTVSFAIGRDVRGLGPTGDGGGRGFLLHSALMVGAQTEEIVGLAAQTIHYRKPVPEGESKWERVQRPRESDVWGRVVEMVGPAPEKARFIHVFDRGADNFEVYCRLLMQRADWVVRAAQLTRNVHDGEGGLQQLSSLLRGLPCAGTYELSLRRTEQHPPRTAKLEVRFSQIGMPTTRVRSPYLRKCDIRLLTMWVVEVREVGAPRGAEALHWVLFTSLPVTTFGEAWKVIEYYEKRPLIEEYHKALKTGCRVQARQYQVSERLEAVTGILSVVAIRLLQLKSVARDEPDRPVGDVVPRSWITLLSQVKPRRTITTVREFFRRLAQLGGFLGRKSDGEPGWITLWRGFEKLQLMLRGADAMRAKCG
jgi:hypothetical protein